MHKPSGQVQFVHQINFITAYLLLISQEKSGDYLLKEYGNKKAVTNDIDKFKTRAIENEYWKQNNKPH